MSVWTQTHLFVTAVLACATLYFYVEARDGYRLSEYYRNKWLEALQDARARR